MIGIVGRKGSGKDTCGDYLVAKHGYIKQSFANPLKRACKEMFSLSDAQLNDPVLKETPDPRWNGATPRQILQFVGTDLFRNQLSGIIPNIGEDVHIQAFKIWFQNQPNKKIVLCDIRFKNEAKFVKENGGILIKVARNCASNNDLHVSEVELESIICDFYIENNGTFDELYSALLGSLEGGCAPPFQTLHNII
jgi:hypothetical protein